jgi:hypothetical protein
MKIRPSFMLCFLSLGTALHAGSRASANYSAVTETVDVTGGLSSSSSYATIGSAGLVAGVATNGSASVEEKRGYIGQLHEVASPEIQVSQPALADLPDGGSRDFGMVPVGSTASLVFTIRNAGVSDLTGLATALDGPDSGMFRITAPPVAPVPGPLGTTTFTVQFAPTALGARTATLRITSNDPDENPFDIVLSGIGIGPEITVQQPEGNSLTSGSNEPVDFGPVPAGGSRSLTFTVRNDGPAALNGLAVTTAADGTPGDFSIGAPAATTLAPAAATTFTVTFSPSAPGARSATLLIASNDEDENPFRISLTGTQATASEAWRITHFGSPANTAPGGDFNDPDSDGLVNLMEFATGSDPNEMSPPVGVLVKGGNFLEFTYTRPKAALPELTYRPEVSISISGTWSIVNVISSILSDDGVTQVVKAIAPAGTGKRFMRLRVTRP